MGLRSDYMTNTPQNWGKNLPQPEQYANVADYLAAVKAAYEADPNQSAPAFAAPSTFTGSDGQQMSAAGYHGTQSADALAAGQYNRMMDSMKNNTAGGTANGLLAAYSRMKVNPQEAQRAYDAYSIGESGMPTAIMNDYMLNLMEGMGMHANGGVMGGGPGGKPGTDKPATGPGGMPLPVPPAGFDPHFPTQPGSGDFGKPPVNVGDPSGRPPLFDLTGAAGGGRPPLYPIDTPSSPQPINPEAVATPGDTRVADSNALYPPEMLARLAANRRPVVKAGY